MKALITLFILMLTANTMNVQAAPQKVYENPALTARLKQIGSRDRELALTEGNWKIDRSLTIPSNVDLKLRSGAKFLIAKGATLTINGDLEVSGLHQVFSGDGKVRFGAGFVRPVYPQWWGKIKGVDDTQACQSALSSGAAEIHFPAATYAINPVGQKGGEDGGLLPESNTVLKFYPGALLQAMTTEKNDYSIINISGKTNVTLDGAVIRGERSTHTGKGGEWGHGIRIRDGATNIVVRNCSVSDCWGDGIYIGEAEKNVNDGIIVENSRFDNNRRNGCSITTAKNVLFKKCAFSRSNGTSPFKGVDVEPNKPEDIIQNIVFEDCNSFGNISTGFSVARDDAQNTPVSVTFRNCISENDGGGFGVDVGPSDGLGFLAIKDCVVLNPGETGFRSTSANLPTYIDGLHIVNPNQKNEPRAQFASGFSLWNVVPQHAGKYKLAGNIKARNVTVESTDGKAAHALYIHNELGDKSGFINLDLQIKTNMEGERRFFKGDGPFLGYARIDFVGDETIDFADKQ